MNTFDFILNNFPKTIRDPKFNGKYLPNSYMTPCLEGIFQNFYYWDTYFINVGLIALNDLDMVRNNLNIMKHFVNLHGFVPNADHLLKGSQPPLFTRGVYDLYQASKDINDIKNYAYACYKELEFWENNRQTKIHLNQHKCSWSNEDCLANFEYFKSRVDGLNEIEEKIDPIELSKDFYSIAESGWDINSRFYSNGNRFAIHKFACLDLNCILFDAENKLSELFNIIGESELSNELKIKANERKILINKYLLSDNNIYLDYNFVNNVHSSLVTVASLYPYAFNISNDKEGAKKVFNLLKEEFGLATSTKINKPMQWDFPSMWPPTTYFAYLALLNVGLISEANWVSNTFIKVVDNIYNKTNKLWEKYNVLTGEVCHSFEYETPTMLGWTAGIYSYFYKKR